MRSRTILAVAGILIALATVAGAFGAHALRDIMAPDRMGIYETAVRYQFYHALGLLAVGLVARENENSALRWSSLTIFIGIALFSGSIYALSFGAPRPFGILTPAGGVALIAGWMLFAASFFTRSR